MDRDRLKVWALTAEIVSGIAVVITLVFLIVEVRGNSDLIRANAFNRSIESLIELRTEIASNEEALRAMGDYWDNEDLETLRRDLLVVNLWSIYEKTYYSHQYGLVGAAEWERFQTRICLYRETRAAYWEENIARFLTEEFREYVRSSCLT
jgi:hypothetical protein